MGVEDTGSVSPDGSTHVDLDAANASQAEQNPGAESSAAPEGEKFDLLSVVRDAVKESREPASPAAQEENSDQPTADDDASKTEPKEQDSENFSDVPFNKHPRFQELVRERNQYREGARQFEQIQSFIRTNGLTPEEAADALISRAEMKSNPQEAWKKLKPLVQQLLIDAGEVLPPDLNEQVQRGLISRDAAFEVSRLRARVGISEKFSERQAEQAQQEAEQRRVQSIVDTVAVWERETRAKDVDFAAKADDLQREVAWLQRRDGVPSTPEAAKKQVEDAYAAVNRRVAASRPRPGKAPVTGGRVAREHPAAQPNSMLELVQRARSAG